MLSVKSTTRRTILPTLRTLAALCVAALTPLAGYAEQPPPPCHPNPQAAADMATVASRGDVALLPTPLKDRLVQLAGRPHTLLPMQVHAGAPGPNQIFQEYHTGTTTTCPVRSSPPTGAPYDSPTRATAFPPSSPTSFRFT